MNKKKRFSEKESIKSPTSIQNSKVFLEAFKALQSKNELLESTISELRSNEKKLKSSLNECNEKLHYFRNSSQTIDTIHEKLLALSDQLSFTKEELSKESSKLKKFRSEKNKYKQSYLLMKSENKRQLQEIELLKQKLKVSSKLTPIPSTSNSSKFIQIHNKSSRNLLHSKEEQSILPSKTRKALQEIINQNDPFSFDNRTNSQKYNGITHKSKNFSGKSFRKLESRSELLEGKEQLKRKNSAHLFRIDSSLFDSSDENDELSFSYKIPEERIENIKGNFKENFNPKKNGFLRENLKKEPGKVRKRCQSLKYNSIR